MEAETEVGVKECHLITIKQNICSNISGTMQFLNTTLRQIISIIF